MSVLRFPSERVRVPQTECRYEGCLRTFKTPRGARHHERRCIMDFERDGNPYIPVKRRGRIVGVCRNTPEAIASFRKVARGVMGSEADVQPLSATTEGKG